MASSSATDRHRPMASERSRKAQQDPISDPIEESEEDVATQEATDDDITDEDAHLFIPEERVDEDRHACPIPGGPEDLSVLISFRTHIAMSIWRGEDRDALKCICHGPKLRSWYLP
ncbi:serine/threonine-protein phosphatase 7 long form [Cinnamomum micranthum f. kanehirae]|uniref:Serine/threonine-protein phosphatase 7 long form n=1 Tax=Cinnamomum micranthum f. kanehirae TaxID=337451 RepID=A0A3S3P0Y8_9MAGN|nr:serine/threonine-protein phosphatase 7 long form [Cinnamomum micranthum f. kanehirae]